MTRKWWMKKWILSKYILICLKGHFKIALIWKIHFSMNYSDDERILFSVYFPLTFYVQINVNIHKYSSIDIETVFKKKYTYIYTYIMNHEIKIISFLIFLIPNSLNWNYRSQLLTSFPHPIILFCPDQFYWFAPKFWTFPFVLHIKTTALYLCGVG